MKKLAIILGAVTLLSAAPALADSKGCPPGLAKKSPACVPPGLAKKGDHDRRYDDRHDDDRRADYERDRRYDWRVGDRWQDRDDYIRIRDWDRYGLPRLGDGEAYYRVGDNVVKVDRDTMKVVGLMGLIGAIAN